MAPEISPACSQLPMLFLGNVLKKKLINLFILLLGLYLPVEQKAFQMITVIEEQRSADDVEIGIAQHARRRPVTAKIAMSRSEKWMCRMFMSACP
jgi:hypothetical protein